MRFGVHSVWNDTMTMLDVVRPDVVHLTTPPHTHRSLALQCLAAGAHVYVEKPFTVNGAEAEEVVAAAEARDRLVCVGHDQLFDPAWEECRRRVAAGKLGEIVHIESVQGYDLQGPFGRLLNNESTHWMHQLPGGLFQNVISHALARILDCMPGPLPVVNAWRFSRVPDEPFPSELRVFVLGATCTGVLVFTSAARPVQRTTRVLGTRSGLEIDLDARSVTTYRAASLPGAISKVQLSWYGFAEAWRNLSTNVTRLRRFDLHYFQGMHTLFERFYGAITTGGDIPVPYAEAIRVTQAMDLIFESWRQRSSQSTQAAQRTGLWVEAPS
jgi:predicted dehydrogenase